QFSAPLFAARPRLIASASLALMQVREVIGGMPPGIRAVISQRPARIGVAARAPPAPASSARAIVRRDIVTSVARTVPSSYYSSRAPASPMEKRIYDAGIESSNAPFNLCVRYGDLLFVSGLPPFDAQFTRAVREARAQGRPIPPFPDMPFEAQARLVLDNMKKLLERAGSSMD